MNMNQTNPIITYNMSKQSREREIFNFTRWWLFLLQLQNTTERERLFRSSLALWTREKLIVQQLFHNIDTMYLNQLAHLNINRAKSMNIAKYILNWDIVSSPLRLHIITKPTLERRKTLGHIRSINLNMIID